MMSDSWAQLDGGRFLADLYAKDSIQAAFQQKIINAVNKLGTTLGANAVGNVQPPPPINNINVSTSGELVQVALNQNQPVSKPINYFVEVDTNPNFTNPQVKHLGPSRSPGPFSLPTFNANGVKQKYYMRAYSQYPGSDPSKTAVFGGSLNPASIELGGTTQMDLLQSTGSGTASPNGQQGGKGFGSQQTTQSIIGTIQNSIGPSTVQAPASGLSTVGSLVMPSIFIVSGALPVTATPQGGAIDVALAVENANKIFAGPTSGSAAIPAFRSLVATDIPILPETKITAAFVTKTGNYLATSGDSGTTFNFNLSSNATITLPAIAPASGWWVEVVVNGTAGYGLTIDPNGLDLDGAAATQTIGVSSGNGIYSDGAGYYLFCGSVALGSAGQLAFYQFSNSVGGSANLYFDYRTNCLGIGTSSPPFGLTVASNELLGAVSTSLSTNFVLIVHVGTNGNYVSQAAPNYLGSGSSGSTIQSLNDAGTATVPLVLTGNPLYLNPFGEGPVIINSGLEVGTPSGGNEGTGTVNAAGAYYANGVAGVSAGPYTVITSITVTNGIITAISGH